jgi:hypothetical protein
MGWSDLLLLLSDTFRPDLNSIGSARAVKPRAANEVPFPFGHHFSAVASSH